MGLDWYPIGILLCAHQVYFYTSVAQLHPADIKAAIEKKGATQAAIAREFGRSPMAVWNVIHGRTKSRKIADRIAEITGLPLRKLWPGVYEDKAA